MDYIDWLHEYCVEKVVSSEQAISAIKKGNRVFIGSGCGEPQHLIRSMVSDFNLQDILVYQMLSGTLSEYIDDQSFLDRFSLKLFFISKAMQKAVFKGNIDYVPAYLSQIPALFFGKHIGLDVALVQVSTPDQFGYCSLGISVDITRAGMQNSRLVIAQINPRMPRTLGDSFVHVDEIDYLVIHEEPLGEYLPIMADNETAKRIGHYVSQLVSDGATLQIGYGQLPHAILKYLDAKKDLGIHTQVITDGFLPLFEKKVITNKNKKKSLLPGRAVASLCMGSSRLYDYVNNNPMFYFRSSEFVSDPVVIARNDNLISISSALEVDLTGQVCSDSLGYLFYSGIGDQVDFLRGSAMSKGGFSIIALPSTARDGKVSRIVSHLSEGAGVATTRGDVNFVVTEYGIAELKGKSIYQRVMELAQIAHPKFREQLIDEAKTHHYIFFDQLPPHREDLIFLEDYKSSFRLRNGKTVEFRPLLPSDEFAFRNFFYSLQAESIYYRFFHLKDLFPHQTIQEQWANVDYRKNMSIIGLTSSGGHKDIMAIASYALAEQGRAEVAFVVREDFQGQGVGSHLLDVIEKIARENDYKGFTATVLRENKAMIHVFRKRYPSMKVRTMGSEVVIDMDFKNQARV
ncbi:Acetyl-CoA hydrolase/transferase C-terminal domain containing protein [Syntrophobacter sp. SbD1]|nr:Acetyl-CoA hydrolase/transferase C-terminal domain containing protein [Syntrophobacter sp. SbD1]